MAFNVWANQGVVVPQVGNDAPEQPSVLYESGAKILTPNGDGNIFKMWFTTGPATTPVGINYAESNDGVSWTRYVSNPVLASRWGGRVFKQGGTYYLFCSTQVFATAIQVYTSSDGLAWTQQNASAIAAGASGWDSAAVGQLNVLTVDGNGKWWGYYYGAQVAGGPTANYYEGLATSTDGIHWIKDANNPVSAFDSGTLADGQAWNGSGALCFAVVGGTYYAWSQTTASSFPGANSNLPTDLMRWRSNSPGGPWTPLNVITYSRTDASEAPNSANGQVADPCVISALGNCYLYYSASTNGSLGTTYTVNAAIASATSLAQLVATFEGVQNVPISANPGLNLQTLASDSFNRADGGLGTNWTLLNAAGFTAAQISSQKVTGSVAGNNDDSWYNAITWPNDQWGQVTINTCLASSFVGVSLRQTAGGNVYRFYWNGTAGNPGTWNIQKKVATTFTTLSSGSLTLNVGDTLLAAVVGVNLYFYWNGLLIGTASDAAISSGNAGLLAIPVTSTANTAISNWSGGIFKNPSGITPGSSAVPTPTKQTDAGPATNSPVFYFGNCASIEVHVCPPASDPPVPNASVITGVSGVNAIGPSTVGNLYGRPTTEQIVTVPGSVQFRNPA